jgi:hypothetical protein
MSSCFEIFRGGLARKTTGIAVVAAVAAIAAALPMATITATGRRTSSLASAGTRSN